MKRIQRVTLVLALAVALSLPIMAAPPSGGFDLVVLATNQLFGNLFTHTNADDSAPLKGQQVGGVARIATLIRQYRDHYPNVLALNEGNAMSGRLEVSYFKGMSMLQALVAAGYDAQVVGNHEWDFKQAGLTALIEAGAKAGLPFLGCNIVSTQDSSLYPGLKPYILKSMGSHKVAVIGVIDSKLTDSMVKADLAGYTFADPISSVHTAAEAARREGADIVIVLAHMFQADSVALARSFSGAAPDRDIDLIISHDIDWPGRIEDKGVLPKLVDGVLIVNAYASGDAVTAVKAAVQGKEFARFEIVNEVVSAERYAEAPAVVNALKPFIEDAGYREMSRVVAYSAVALPRYTDPAKASPWDANKGILPQLVTDAQRIQGKADVAVMNPGGIRAPLPAGPVTFADLKAIQPFGNHLWRFKAPGSIIINTAAFGKFIISGVLVTRDSSGKVLSVTIGGKPVDPAAMYVVVTNNFIYGGGDQGDLPKKLFIDVLGSLESIHAEDIGVDVDFLARHLASLGPNIQNPFTLAKMEPPCIVTCP